MSELIMVKTPRVYTRRGGTNPQRAEQVVGITIPDSETMMEYGYKPTGRESEEALRLNDDAAARLVEFYERCRVAKPEDRPFHNCHLLAWYITGCATDLQAFDRYRLAKRPVPTTTLEVGEIYAVRSAAGRFPHTMIGIERPDHSLSVTGDNLSIAVIGNAEIMSLYDGAEIHHVIPKSVVPHA